MGEAIQLSYGASEFSNLRLVLSAIFIFLGCFAFYVASLVSGHNIYRDLHFSLAMLTTTLIGFILFIFSPICFVVFFPELFVHPTPKHTTDLLAKIHPIVLNQALPPYLFLGIGLGLVIGCLRVVQIRRLVLEAMRSRGQIEFGIRSYDYAWDHFLAKIKRYGKIIVKEKDSDVVNTYRLIAYSTQDEPKALVLENDRGNSDVLLTDFSSVRVMEVPRSSLKKGCLSEVPTSIGMHLSLAGIGAVFLSVGFFETRSVLMSTLRARNDYAALYSWYLYAAVLCGVAAAVLFMLAVYEITREYDSFAAAIVLCPWPFRVTVFGLLIALIAGAFMFSLDQTYDRWKLLSLHYNGISVLVALMLVVFLLIQNRMRKRLTDFFSGVRTQLETAVPEGERELLSDALWSIVLNYDVNKKHHPANLTCLVDEQFAEVKYTAGAVEALLDPAERPGFLGREKICVIRSFLWYWDRVL